MVLLKRKTINKKTYYYIEHSYRKDGEILKKEKYLGPKIPKNIDKLKDELLIEVYEELWFKKFDIIKENYNKNLKKMPESIQNKIHELTAKTLDIDAEIKEILLEELRKRTQELTTL